MIVARYSEHQRRKGYSPRTIKARRYRLGAFALYLSLQSPPSTLATASTPQIIDWLDTLRDSTSDTTRGQYVSCLSSFYSWAVRSDLIPMDPTVKIERPKPRRYLPRPANDDDLSHCLSIAKETDPRMYAWIHLGAYQGMRCIEIARLQVEHMDRRAMSLWILGKGNRERVVPLHKETFKALVRYGLPTSGHVFLKESANPANPATARPLSEQTISLYGGRFFRDNDSPIRMHQLRHWFGTKVNAASDLLTARDLLGHSSTATTEIYTAVDVSRAAPVVGALSVA